MELGNVGLVSDFSRYRHWQPGTAHGDPNDQRIRITASLRSSAESIPAGQFQFFEVATALMVWTDIFCIATHIDTYFWVHEVVRAAFL